MLLEDVNRNPTKYRKSDKGYDEIQLEKKREAVASLLRTPLEFGVPKDESNAAWGRAQSFVGKYSGMKLQVATDFVLQTYNSIEGRAAYQVVRSPGVDKDIFTVNCSNTIFYKEADANARILAHFIQTGEIPFPELITR